jgi:hypothetical protein
MEVVWHRKGVFSHVGTPVKDWARVLDRAAAVRLLENIELGRWTTIYEVDVVDSPSQFGKPDRRRTIQYIVSEVPGERRGRGWLAGTPLTRWTSQE